jgi:hypothetical protein
MLTIQITENIQGAETKSFNVTKYVYNHLLDIENMGGFKRFNMQVYEDKVKGQKITPLSEIAKYLNTIFILTTYENLLSILKIKI